MTPKGTRIMALLLVGVLLFGIAATAITALV